MASLAADPGDWTADQITEAIALAIGGHDFKAVTSLIRMLAVKDPHRAELVYESVKAGLSIRRQSAEDPAARCNRCAAPASCSESGRCVLENGERPASDSLMSCPCGRGDYDLCADCPYDWCSVHGGESAAREGAPSG